jgi:hypothetical protein
VIVPGKNCLVALSKVKLKVVPVKVGGIHKSLYVEFVVGVVGVVVEGVVTVVAGVMVSALLQAVKIPVLAKRQMK